MNPCSENHEEPAQPGLNCWFCAARLRLADVLDDGILRSRTESQGGPFRLFSCPKCHRHNICEKTPRRRWFSSPDFRPNLLDYLVGKLFLPNPEDFLRAVSWYRENEERRRYFFERDGDQRYSGSGILSMLWASDKEESKKTRKAKTAGADERGGKGSRASRGDSPPPRGDRSRSGRSIASPWEILGIDRSAEETEIRRAFHRLAVQYHPDKVHHLGEEFQRLATQKFKELQKAYETLMKRRSV